MNTFILEEKDYNLNQEEVTLLEEASLFLNNNNNLYALYELYNAFYIQILRRIEFYNKDKVLKKLNKENLFKKEETSIFKRWENIKVIDIIKSAKDFKIINKTAYHLFLSFHNYKVETSLEEIIQTEYLFSFFTILKEELFKQDFINQNDISISQHRRLSDNKDTKRRREDKELQYRREKDKEIKEVEEEEILINTKNINPIAAKDLLNKENIFSIYEKEVE